LSLSRIGSPSSPLSCQTRRRGGLTMAQATRYCACVVVMAEGAVWLSPAVVAAAQHPPVVYVCLFPRRKNVGAPTPPSASFQSGPASFRKASAQLDFCGAPPAPAVAGVIFSRGSRLQGDYRQHRKGAGWKRGNFTGGTPESGRVRLVRLGHLIPLEGAIETPKQPVDGGGFGYIWMLECARGK